MKDISVHISLSSWPFTVLAAPSLHFRTKAMQSHIGIYIWLQRHKQTPEELGHVYEHIYTPAVHHSKYRYRWHPGILSATGFPLRTFSHHHNKWTHLDIVKITHRWVQNSPFKTSNRLVSICVPSDPLMQAAKDWNFNFGPPYLRGSHLNSPLPLPRQVQLIM